MKGAHPDLTQNKTSLEAPPGLDATHVLVAAETTIASSTLAAELRADGYVATTCPHRDVVGYLRTHKTIELLVLDGAKAPSTASALLDTLRATNWMVPIILIAGRDRELRAEADRLGVEAVLDAPLRLGELRRAAARIAPVVREPLVVERSNGSPLWQS
jgi:DNA-binding response OmpR family regulator